MLSFLCSESSTQAEEDGVYKPWLSVSTEMSLSSLPFFASFTRQLQRNTINLPGVTNQYRNSNRIEQLTITSKQTTNTVQNLVNMNYFLGLYNMLLVIISNKKPDRARRTSKIQIILRIISLVLTDLNSCILQSIEAKCFTLLKKNDFSQIPGKDKNLGLSHKAYAAYFHWQFFFDETPPTIHPHLSSTPVKILTCEI